jgi:hypothetical protein
MCTGPRKERHVVNQQLTRHEYTLRDAAGEVVAAYIGPDGFTEKTVRAEADRLQAVPSAADTRRERSSRQATRGIHPATMT